MPDQHTAVTGLPRSIILAMEDEAEREFLADLLEASGFRVTQAHNGKAAMKLLAEHPTDFLLTDIVMAEKDGLELIQDVRKHYLGVRPIAMCGGPRADGYLSLARLMGAEAILKKPLNVDQLLQTLRQFSK